MRTRPSLVFVLLLTAAPLVGQRAVRSPASAPRRPDVLFIAIDDLNDWIGVLGGHPQARTPNLDRLAGRGVLFTNAHCAAPACNPSRVALLTGIPPHRSGVYLNAHPWRPALPDAVTLPQHFRQHGYVARGSGKIFHSAFLDPPSWDEYFPSKQRQHPGDPQPPQRPVNGIPRTRHFDWGPVAVADAAMGDAKVADWVAAQLRRERAAQAPPVFLACGFFRPHLPWYVPTAYFDQYPLAEVQLPKVLADDLDDVPAAGRAMAKPDGDHRRVLQHDQWKPAVRGYLASIAFADKMLGRLLDALDDSGRAADTVIVLWTDHGWSLGEKQHWRKFALWEDTTRTPLMIVVPKGAPGLPAGTVGGRRCARSVSLLDIYPTLLELCGLGTRKELAGRSLVPLLRDPQAAWDRPVVTTQGRGNHAVRGDRWRLIRYADGSEELYDHRSDPHEWHNLAGDPEHAAVKQRLAKWLPRADAPAAARRRR